MKRVMILFLMFSSFAAFAQDGENDCIIVAEDVVCTDNVVSFTLSATSDGVPHVVSNSATLSFGITPNDQSQPPVISFTGGIQQSVDELEITAPLLNEATCDDIVDQTLYLLNLPGNLEDDGYASCESNTIPVEFEAALPPAVPTLGEWGLIILSLFLVIFGVIGIRSKKSEFLLS